METQSVDTHKQEENKKLWESTTFNQQHSQGFEVKPMQQVGWEQTQKPTIDPIATKCFCGQTGNWYERMLECQRCKRWFHEKCVGCLQYKLVCGDRFYLYVCKFCNSGREFLYRLPINWENIVHLVLWNLSNSKSYSSKNGKYFEYEEQITTWVNNHWELLQCPPDLQNIPIRDRAQHILLALKGNKNKFKCGKEVRKKTSIWALKVADPPSVLEIILPPESPITTALMHRISYCERTTELTPIPKTFKVDAVDPVLQMCMKPQVGSSNVVDLDTGDDNKVASSQIKQEVICLRCNMSLNGIASVKQHLDGRRHREQPKNKASAIMKKIPKFQPCLKECPTGELLCECCQMKFKTPWSVKYHLNGAMHIKLREEMEKVADNNSAAAAAPPPPTSPAVAALPTAATVRLPVAAAALSPLAAADHEARCMVSSSSSKEPIGVNVNADPVVPTSTSERKLRVVFDNIPKGLKVSDLQEILNIFGAFEKFDMKLRKSSATDMCSAHFQDVQSIMRCERLLHNRSILDTKLQVTIPYKDSFTLQEKVHVMHSKEKVAASILKKVIKRIEDEAKKLGDELKVKYSLSYKKDFNEKLAKAKLAFAKKAAIYEKSKQDSLKVKLTQEKKTTSSIREDSVTKSPDRRDRRSDSKESDKISKRSKSRSPDKRHMSSRSSSRERVYSRSRSRSVNRRRKRSRSRSTDKKYKTSKSHEKSPDRSGRKKSSRSPVRRDRKKSSRSPNRRDKNHYSKSPARSHRRSRSRSPDRRHMSSRSRSRERVYSRSRSRSVSRRRKRSRSRSTDKKYKTSKSHEKSSRRSESVERVASRHKRDRQRSPFHEEVSNEVQSSDFLDSKLRNYGKTLKLFNEIGDTDVAIIDKENIRVDTIMKPIFEQCGGKPIWSDSTLLLYKFKTRERAQIVYNLLNRFRTPFGRAKLLYNQKFDHYMPEDSQETVLVMGIINENLKNIQKTHKVITKELNARLGITDPYSFKTKKCVEKCQIDICPYYHTEEQRRRNPSKISYMPVMCSQYRLGSCFLQDDCNKCHSQYELNFHIEKIHKKVCANWYTKSLCNFDFESPICCNNAHPETPEVLFNDVWRDVYIAELKNTFHYLVGALQNLRFVNTQPEGIYILIVTPSIYMVHWLIGVTKSLATDLKVDIHMVTDETDITEREKHSNLLLCTPAGIVRLLKIPGVDLSRTLACLILDDVTLLLHRHKNEMDFIGKSLLTSPLEICKVAVADKIYEQDVKELSTQFYSNFSILGSITSKEQEKELPSSATIDSILSSSSNSQENELSNAPQTQKNNENLPKSSNQLSVEGVCQLLMSFCDKIGILGHSLRAALEKIHKCGNDSHKILQSLSDSESQELLILISSKFKRLQEEAKDKILQQNYFQAYNATNFLMDSTKSHSENVTLDFDDYIQRPESTNNLRIENSGVSSKSTYDTRELYYKTNSEEGHSMDYVSSSTSTETSNRNITNNIATSSTSNMYNVSENSQGIGSGQLTSNEMSLIQRLLGKNSEYDPSFSMGLTSDLTNPLKTVTDMRLDGTNQNTHNSGYLVANRDLSQQFSNGVFKVAIFGHDYVNLLPLYSGEIFQSKPGIPYQVIKYAKKGAELMKVQDYSIWNEVISSQPHMIFLILGKNDVSAYISPQELANGMLIIKNNLDNKIPNVRIVCFGLENCLSDFRWSGGYQETFNRYLGAGFNWVILPSSQIDISNGNSEAVRRVWIRMQEMIDDIQLQQMMLHNFAPK